MRCTVVFRLGLSGPAGLSPRAHVHAIARGYVERLAAALRGAAPAPAPLAFSCARHKPHLETSCARLTNRLRSASRLCFQGSCEASEKEEAKNWNEAHRREAEIVIKASRLHAEGSRTADRGGGAEHLQSARHAVRRVQLNPGVRPPVSSRRPPAILRVRRRTLQCGK